MNINISFISIFYINNYQYIENNLLEYKKHLEKSILKLIFKTLTLTNTFKYLNKCFYSNTKNTNDYLLFPKTN